ncbi:hypothetical protein SDC9_190826 [bioreactor metagenome]|uniref:Uncharacterized protein n=1 Tax=bioreactor metagenome TaxID=1076179 RepID=A0A645HW97_9ZZZZ
MQSRPSRSRSGQARRISSSGRPKGRSSTSKRAPRTSGCSTRSADIWRTRTTSRRRTFSAAFRTKGRRSCPTRSSGSAASMRSCRRARASSISTAARNSSPTTRTIPIRSAATAIRSIPRGCGSAPSSRSSWI